VEVLGGRKDEISILRIQISDDEPAAVLHANSPALWLGFISQQHR